MSIAIRNQILEFIKNKKNVKPKEIQDFFNLSLSTTRRYLLSLSKDDLIEKHFGEIIFKNDYSVNIEYSANSKISQNINSKKKIAKKAAEFNCLESPIYLDSGSNCYYLLDYLPKKTIIYTNSLLNASKAIDIGFKNVHILGGKIKENTKAIVNLEQIYIERVNFSVSFMGVNGISVNEDLTTPEENEGICKMNIMNNSEKIVILCEKQKLGKKSFFNFSVNDKEIIVITDNEVVPEFANKYKYITTEGE
ncbi:MAG: FaeA/PapI family transcriptional regulator [Metamycoplasmataceae bacterium]